ncbi:hypothetical protein [Thalassotalea crassostreae]|uniref:hypothetical protein n=1 Tax=Thalassotalea crassostreae TaxID=1763536 RepID=UPI000838A23D|nr:hypothetical protein [Thalassotalea crassostreae]
MKQQSNDSIDMIANVLAKQKRSSVLTDTKLFADFNDMDSVLAAYVDKQLSAEQHLVFKTALASQSALRQQWLHCLEAKKAQEQTLNDKSKGAGKDIGKDINVRNKWRNIIASAASFACVTVLVFWFNNQTPQGELLAEKNNSTEQVNADSLSTEPLTAPTSLLKGQQQSAPVLASNAVPVFAWEMYLAVYLGWTQEIGTPAKPAEEFAFLAVAALALNKKNCNSENSAQQLATLKQRFNDLVKKYPAEMIVFNPSTKSQWCELGNTLKQHAKMTVYNNKQ